MSSEKSKNFHVFFSPLIATFSISVYKEATSTFSPLFNLYIKLEQVFPNMADAITDAFLFMISFFAIPLFYDFLNCFDIFKNIISTQYISWSISPNLA